MAIKYFLDGYNLLFRMCSLERSLRLHREEILADLGEKARILHLSLTIVFDAGYQKNEENQCYSYHTLNVIFTQYRETADQWIIQAIEKMTCPKSVVVVTSDKGLQRAIHRQGARSLEIDEFLLQINRRVLKKKRSIDKRLVQRPIFHSSPPPTPPSKSTTEDYLEVFEARFKDLEKSKRPPSLTPKGESDYHRWLRLFSQRLDSGEIF